ncbi:NRDE-2, necessary for RNA interference-domain-containing protein [Cyathus striatus]|nr:NRDE-2, necessary for RNA interference-domain-containing protein [Cyathus striatus]
MSAPSFSSFPPSFSSFPELDAGNGRTSQSSNEERIQEQSRKSSRSEHNHRKGKEKKRDKESAGEKERRKDKDRHRSRHDESRRYDASPKRPVDIDSEDSHRFFYSDRKGDPLNIIYGGLHAGDVPKYRLVEGMVTSNESKGGRRILGLPNIWTAYKRTGKGIEIGLRSRWKVSGLTDSGSRSLLNAPPTRRILHSDASTRYEEVDGFIRLPSRRGRPNPEDSYRSITRGNDNSDSEQSSGDEKDDVSSDEESGELVLTSLQETLKSLENDLSLEPSAVEKWLHLLTHSLSTIPVTSKNATKARSEISVSILSRALSAHPLNSSSKQLRLKYLKAGEEIWHESKLRAEWEDALKVGGVEIWMEWLEWRIRVGSEGVEGVVRDGTRAMEAFENDEEGETAKLRSFWRIAVAFQNAGRKGYNALSLLGFTMLQVSGKSDGNVSSAGRAVLDELEEFWEAEVPRLGEEGARGWSHWYSTDKPEVQMSRSGTKPNQIVDLDPYRQWAAEEAEGDRCSCMPMRSIDEQVDSDPYSTVLFADIRALMLTSASPQMKEAFRIAWLSILGLEVPGFVSSLSTLRDLNWDDRWSKGYLVRPSYLNMMFPEASPKVPLLTDATAGTVIGREKEYENSFGPVKCWGLGVRGPLDIGPGGEKGFGTGVTWQAWTRGWAVRRSKELLATARDSLAHWKAHADLERMRGKLDEARKVYQAVLVAAKPNRKQAWISQLWWSWAEMEWLAGQREVALNVVLRSVDLDGKGGGVVVLRGKRMLEDAIEGERSWKDREGWINILRERVERGLEEYPSNSVILGIFLEGEKGEGVWGRVRGILGGGEMKDVARRVEEVWIAGWEKGRWMGEVERTRSGLAAAVETERTRGSSVIWRLYIEFELRAGAYERAKKLLFRAVGECPLVKELYLLAFGPLRRVFRGDELRALGDTMAERGIRLRRGLDEALEGWEGETGEGEGEERERETGRRAGRWMKSRTMRGSCVGFSRTNY